MSYSKIQGPPSGAAHYNSRQRTHSRGVVRHCLRHVARRWEGRTTTREPVARRSACDGAGRRGAGQGAAGWGVARRGGAGATGAPRRHAARRRDRKTTTREPVTRCGAWGGAGRPGAVQGGAGRGGAGATGAPRRHGARRRDWTTTMMRGRVAHSGSVVHQSRFFPPTGAQQTAHSTPDPAR